MADQSPLPLPSPPPSPTSQSTSTRSRSITRLQSIAKRRNKGEKTSLEIDVHTGVASGPNAAPFQSYLGFIARDKISILIPHWEDVPEAKKNMLWQDILLTYDIPNVESLRLKVISSIGKKWRQFKSKLTSKYIFGKENDISPCTKYRGIDEETWQKFVESRTTPDWEKKRIKAKEIQAHNDCPHTLSRGGYQLLVKKMVNKKRKQQECTSSDPTVIINPPSPPSRHETWKAARMKKTGAYTSEQSQMIAEKIDSLVEQSSQGSFVSQGRQDILTTAIGKPEHPGRVRGIGTGVGIRQYFGKPDTQKSGLVSQQVMDELRQSITKESC